MIKNILIVFLFSIFFSIQVFAQNKILEFNKNTEFVFPKGVNIQNYTISTSFVYPDSIIELPKFTGIVKAFHDKYGTQKMKSFIDNKKLSIIGTEKRQFLREAGYTSFREDWLFNPYFNENSSLKGKVEQIYENHRFEFENLQPNKTYVFKYFPKSAWDIGSYVRIGNEQKTHFLPKLFIFDDIEMPLSFSAFYNDEVKKVELKYTLRDISYDELEKYTGDSFDKNYISQVLIPYYKITYIPKNSNGGLHVSLQKYDTFPLSILREKNEIIQNGKYNLPILFE